MRAVALTLIVAAACGGQGQDAIRWSVRAPATAKLGAKVKATLTATVSEGWHLYSMKQLEGGPKPTRIEVPEGRPFRLVGEVDAPGPVIFHDPNFDLDVELYEESANFVLPLFVARDAKPGKQKLVVSARFQACNDKLCLPPKTAMAEAVVDIRQ